MPQLLETPNREQVARYGLRGDGVWRRIAKSRPTPSDVHVDRPLTTMSLAFIQSSSGFGALRCFPLVPVENQTDKYFTYNRSDWYRDGMQRRGPGSESAGGGWRQSTDSYSCDVFSLHKDNDNQMLANADSPLDPLRDSQEYLSLQALIRREVQFAADAFTTSVWTGDLTGGSSFTKWSDHDNSDPIEDIEKGKDNILSRTGFKPNLLCLGYQSWRHLKQHPQIVSRISGGSTIANPALVTRQLVAQLFELEELCVSEAVYCTSVEDAATDTYAYVLGKHALLLYRPKTPGIRIPSAGYTFAWRGLGQGLGGGQVAGAEISQFYVQTRKSMRVEIETGFDHKIVSADLGQFYSNAVA